MFCISSTTSIGYQLVSRRDLILAQFRSNTAKKIKLQQKLRFVTSKTDIFSMFCISSTTSQCSPVIKQLIVTKEVLNQSTNQSYSQTSTILFLYFFIETVNIFQLPQSSRLTLYVIFSHSFWRSRISTPSNVCISSAQPHNKAYRLSTYCFTSRSFSHWISFQAAKKIKLQQKLRFVTGLWFSKIIARVSRKELDKMELWIFDTWREIGGNKTSVNYKGAQNFGKIVYLSL